MWAPSKNEIYALKFMFFRDLRSSLSSLFFLPIFFSIFIIFSLSPFLLVFPSILFIMIFFFLFFFHLKHLSTILYCVYSFLLFSSSVYFFNSTNVFGSNNLNIFFPWKNNKIISDGNNVQMKNKVRK